VLDIRGNRELLQDVGKERFCTIRRHIGEENDE